MPRPRPSGAARLTVDGRIHQGYVIVAEWGLAALNVDRLCDRLGVTKGSFYRHFDDPQPTTDDREEHPMAGMRDTVTHTFQKRIANPVMRRLPFQTLLETTGRTSGQPRRTPLGGRRIGDQFWFVSEFGERSQYIRNIKADPHVRVRLRGRWHPGVAHLLPEDDPRVRLRELPQFNSFGVRTFGTDLLTVQVDLTG